MFDFVSPGGWGRVRQAARWLQGVGGGLVVTPTVGRGDALLAEAAPEASAMGIGVMQLGARGAAAGGVAVAASNAAPEEPATGM